MGDFLCASVLAVASEVPIYNYLFVLTWRENKQILAERNSKATEQQKGSGNYLSQYSGEYSKGCSVDAENLFLIFKQS